MKDWLFYLMVARELCQIVGTVLMFPYAIIKLCEIEKRLRPPRSVDES